MRNITVSKLFGCQITVLSLKQEKFVENLEGLTESGCKFFLGWHIQMIWMVHFVFHVFSFEGALGQTHQSWTN